MNNIELPLTSKNNIKICYDYSLLDKDTKELELFLDGDNYMKQYGFSKKILLSREVKANNSVEGFNDDVGLVYNILYNHLCLL